MIGISIVSVVVLLGVLIFAHEFGHFLMAKRAGVGVLKFSLGFGPRIIGRKIGETEYLLSLIPLGGYVKLLGESPGEELSAEDEKRSFLKQPVWKRIGIVAAGPVFNLLLAIADLHRRQHDRTSRPDCGNRRPATRFRRYERRHESRGQDHRHGREGRNEMGRDLRDRSTRSKGRPLRITVQRDGRCPGSITVTPKLMKTTNHLRGRRWRPTRSASAPSPRTVIERQNPLSAFGKGLRQTWMISKLTVDQHRQDVSGGRFAEEPGRTDPDRPDRRGAGRRRESFPSFCSWPC